MRDHFICQNCLFFWGEGPVFFWGGGRQKRTVGISKPLHWRGVAIAAAQPKGPYAAAGEEAGAGVACEERGGDTCSIFVVLDVSHFLWSYILPMSGAGAGSDFYIRGFHPADPTRLLGPHRNVKSGPCRICDAMITSLSGEIRKGIWPDTH